MRSQNEELLWIGAQEDNIIPIEILKFAVESRFSLAKLLEFSEKDFKGVTARSISNFFEKTNKIDVQTYQNIWNAIQQQRISLITYDDPYFPFKLRETDSRTVLLYHKGLQLPFEKCIAVVGTRKCSTHAAEFTRDLSRKLASLDYVVVAGLARGIDSIAHRGALSVGGKTIAVLPWMFNPYPPENQYLLSEIIKSGFVLSDTFFTTRGQLAKGKFVHRNEIISGISDYLIAVESGVHGGTTHQVEIALRQKKVVITPEPEEKNENACQGFEKFVKLGAIPVKTVDEVIDIIQNQKHKKPQEIDTTLLEFSE